eukprot:1021941-Pelagomonas_calceolata.AAC.5
MMVRILFEGGCFHKSLLDNNRLKACAAVQQLAVQATRKKRKNICKGFRERMDMSSPRDSMYLQPHQVLLLEYVGRKQQE